MHIPVFANGDIRTVEDAQRCFEQTGCAGLMVARGALTNPWIFSQIAAARAGREPKRPTPADYHHLIRHYADLLQQDISSEAGVLGKLKYLMVRMRTGLPDAGHLRQKVARSQSLEQALDRIDSYFGLLTPAGLTGTTLSPARGRGVQGSAPARAPRIRDPLPSR